MWYTLVMKIEIAETTEYVRRMLVPMRGTVHSVYRRTVNLLFPEGAEGEPFLLALQERGSPVSPVSALLPAEAGAFFAAPPLPGTEVVADGNGLFFTRGDEILLTENTAVHPAAVPAAGPDKGRAAFLARTGREILRRNARGGFGALFAGAGAGEDLVLRAAESRLADARRALEEENWTACADSLASLLGLGGGLTPSGDDFLCGVLAGFCYLAANDRPLAEELRRRVRLRLGDTHAISAAFLRCSLDGETSLPVLTFLTLPDDASEKEKQAAAEALLSVGHTSGLDSLCGLVFVFSLAGG